jgi:hypothetical protein
MTLLPGISGSLFPGRFLADGLTPTVGCERPLAVPDAESKRRIVGWWRRVEATCGPATGLRALFDLVAMPLAGILGYRAHDVAFERFRITARLTTRRGAAVGLVLLPWAARPSRLWRDLAAATRTIGADWCLLVAPPFISVVDARGHALRRSVDFTLPDALDDRSVPAFWALCQAGAFDPGEFDGRDGVTPIDLLVSRAAAFQNSVRQDLQAGVVRAIGAIGPVLQQARHAAADRRFTEALTLVYRILFLLFAESRDLVPRHHPAYGRSYAMGALCRDAARDAHESVGLWDGLAAVTRLSRSGCDGTDLIVRPFNGRLFARASAPSLETRGAARVATRASVRRDHAVAVALTALGTRPGAGGREEISYADLGVEQLGAVYERVLDLDPGDVVAGAHDPAVVGRMPARGDRQHSARRKETGTFYTPQPLAEYVVRRTLSPLVRGATTDGILALRIVDPAMGSGAFLVAACRYLAHAYESALIQDGRCAETDLDANERADIRRLVAVRCLAGVDSNPVAVQLARLSLWLTTLAKDKPLNFLDDRLRVGNSLVGASPDDLWRVTKRVGARRPDYTTPLLDAAGLETALCDISGPLRELRERKDDTVADVRVRERLWSGLSGDRSPLEPWRVACHLWCARWFWPDGDGPGPPSASELGAALDAVLRGDRTLRAHRVRSWVDAARAAARARGFFHWPLEFPDVFYGDTGKPRDPAGFDAVIGNPPWEVLRRDPGEPGALEREARSHDGLRAFLRQSGLYPSCDRGHVNLYQPFLERAIGLTRTGGRVGLVLPWGLASDEGAAALRARLINRCAVDSIAGFDNAAAIFPIHRGLRFMVLVASPGSPPREMRARFGLRDAVDINALPGDDEAGEGSAFPVRLSPNEIRQVSGPSLRIPDVRRPATLDWLLKVSRAFPRLGDRSGWAAEFGRELNATEDRTSFGPDGLIVIEGKHIGPFVVNGAASTRRITARRAGRLLPDGRFARPRLGYRDVSGASNRFTLIAAVIPANVVTTHTLFCLRTPMPLDQQHFLCGIFNSAAVNAIVRMLMGGHVTTSLVESLPIPAWTGSAEQVMVAALAKRLAAGPDDAGSMEELNRLVDAMYGRTS